MDFAPYQSSPPEHGRVASPEYSTSSPRASQDARRPFSPAAAARSPPPLQHPQPQRGWSGFDGQTTGWSGGASNGAEQPVPGAYPAVEVSEFDTSLGLRLDYEACLAYLALPPLGAIVLLILERNSDYVRCVGWVMKQPCLRLHDWLMQKQVSCLAISLALYRDHGVPLDLCMV